MNLLSTVYPFKILVVEDNFINQKLIQKLFEILGYKTDLVANGIEALKILETKSYHLVLMDIQMPLMNGYEASKLINEKLGPRAPVIIALTANPVSGEEEKYKMAGMSGYLFKPLRLQELTDLICHWGELKKDLFANPIDD
jgi:two-component system, sensor histidine kinase and response regulator